MNLFNLLASTQETTSSSALNPSATPSGGNPWMTWIVYGLLIVVMIIFFVSSSKRRKKQQEEIKKRYESLAVGDTILTIGMICGTIVEICADGTIVLSTGSEDHPGYIRIDKQAIYQFKKKQEQADPFLAAGESTSENKETETAPQETASTEEPKNQDDSFEVVQSTDDENKN